MSPFITMDRRPGRGAGTRGPRRTPRALYGQALIERLEGRVTPVTSTWSGAVDNVWSTAGNWDNVPVDGNDLVFPAGASNTTNVNDLGSGHSFASLTVDSGYTITGDAMALTGTVSVSQATGTTTVSAPLDFGTTVGTVNVGASDASLVLSGVVSGSNGLTLTGQGRLVLSAANTYTGTTTVGGTLIVNGSQSGSPVSVNTGATLGGTGTTGAVTVNQGALQPGDSGPGVFTVAGDVTLNSGSTFTAALNGTAAGTQYTQLQASGVVTLGGATLSATAGFTPAPNDGFVLIDNTGTDPISGTFNGLAEGATTTVSGLPYRVSYVGGDGNDVVLTALTATTTSLATTPNPADLGQSVTLTATVAQTSGTDVPTGSVEFFNGSSSLGTSALTNGVATLNISTLPAGTNPITAKYLGDGDFGASTSAAVNQLVAVAPTTTSLSASPNPSVTGQNVAFTATVAPTSGTDVPTGSVEFFNGSTSLGTVALTNGVAIFTTSTLGPGTNTVTAKYLGDSEFGQSTSSVVSQQVNLAATTTTVTVEPTTSVVGESVTLTATIAVTSPGAGTPTGTVQFFNGTTSLGTGNVTNGVATLTITTLPAGTASITARYSGDANFSLSTSSAVSSTVSKASTTTTLTATPNPSTFGQTVTLTATVAAVSPGAGTASGTVQFFNGGTSLGTATLTNGVATLTTSALAAGSSSLTATYLGDTNYTTSTSAAVTQTVGQTNTTTTLTVSKSNPSAYESVLLTATVTQTSGTGTAAGTVVFYANGQPVGSGVLANGVANLVINVLPIGVTEVTAVYLGSGNNTESTSAPVTVVVGTDAERFVNAVYLQAFNHQADPNGLQYWTTQLATGKGRAWVVRQITTTPAARNTGVQNVYQTYLGRSASATEVAIVQREAVAQGVNIRSIVLGTKEFYQSAGGTVNDYLNALATDVLGTTFPNAVQAKLAASIRRGTSLTKVAENVLLSGSGKRSLVQSAYQSILGRDATSRELVVAIDRLNSGTMLRQISFSLLSSQEFYLNSIAVPDTDSGSNES